MTTPVSGFLGFYSFIEKNELKTENIMQKLNQSLTKSGGEIVYYHCAKYIPKFRGTKMMWEI